MISKFFNDAEKMPNKEHLMHELGEVLDDYFKDLKHAHPHKYKHVKCEMYKTLYGEHLNEEKALKAVAGMDNVDGTKGEHWTLAQVDTVIKQNAIPLTDYTLYDFYYVLNMMYSDFYKVLGTDVNMYVKMAKAWLDDPDVPKGKAFRYYMYVVK